MIEALNKIPGLEKFSHKSRVETETVKNLDIIYVDGQPIAFKMNTAYIPVLTNKPALEKIPKVTVDMGAVPHVVGGADIMAPGVRSIHGSFTRDELVVIVDEKYGKSLAVGRSLLDSETLASTKKGKVITNLHYVGDPVWEMIKPLASR